MNKILITGANGLLGQKLVLLFSTMENTAVIASGKGPLRINFQNVTYLDVDLANRNEVFAAFIKVAPTHIIHAAAVTQVDLCEHDNEMCWRNNVIASENLIELAEELDAYFQYISTDFVFDGTDGPYKETDQPHPINFYGKSKHVVEQLLMKCQLDYAIVRTVLVYGVGQNLSRSNLVLWVKNKLENQEPIRVVNDQWRSPTLVEDLAKGCKLILEKNATGIFHISGKEYLTPYDIALQTAKIFGLDADLISPTDASTFKEIGTRPLKTGFDISKSIKELGFEPVSLQAGLMFIKDQLLSLRSE